MSWPLAAAAASAVLNGIIGVLAYVRSRGRSLYVSLALISFSFSAWSVGYLNVYPDFSDPLWMKVFLTPLAILPGAALSFIWSFTGIPRGMRRLRTVPLYAAGLGLVFLLWSGNITTLQFRAAFIFGGFPVFALGILLLFRNWRDAQDPAEKNRRGYMLAAFWIAVFGGFSDFLPTVGVPFLSLANVCLMLYSLIVLTAIERHYLLDLKSAARRAFVLILAGVLVASVLTAMTWLTTWLEGSLFMTFFLLALASVIALPLLWERINRAFNQLVFLRQAEHDRALEALEKELAGAPRLEAVEEALGRCARAMWGTRAEVYWLPGKLRGLTPRGVMPESYAEAMRKRPQVYTVPGLLREKRKPVLKALRKELEERGCRAIAPIVREGEVVGALAISAASQGFYDLSDLRDLRRIGVSAGRAVRSVELAQESLHADRLAQMGELAAGIAHEIRNPLSAILGAVELLKRGPAADRGEYLDVLKEEVQGLDALVTELVDYASPGAREARVRWSDAWDRARRLLKPELTGGISLECEAPEPSPWVGVSGAHLQQILLNLLKNAARACAEATAPEIRVRATAEKGVFTLEVLDNGKGIPEEMLERLFVPFETKSPGGTGLGLAMVRRLAELYGGRARAENRRGGGGARFLVELPSAKEPDSA